MSIRTLLVVIIIRIVAFRALERLYSRIKSCI